jgi:hypothetical protein
MLATIVLAYGVVATAPAWAASPSHQDLKICIHILGIHKCIRA